MYDPQHSNEQDIPKHKRPVSFWAVLIVIFFGVIAINLIHASVYEFSPTTKFGLYIVGGFFAREIAQTIRSIWYGLITGLNNWAKAR